MGVVQKKIVGHKKSQGLLLCDIRLVEFAVFATAATAPRDHLHRFFFVFIYFYLCSGVASTASCLTRSDFFLFYFQAWQRPEENISIVAHGGILSYTLYEPGHPCVHVHSEVMCT